ncbi:MAG: hypothetical protein A2487_10580 [Candidatus Raymondbacteria bacterium RifOxyC12_full_50_8]|uniref:Guanylate cyclase domain-containing protein n=1 Tax=Candidatus Raymondbacteria bacterium RIFOXYD12_FULL_49_13 TaxID=1817890 RepID=A0A1F7F0V3_UNCRA|nr:MAG: hypothetical protein A2248_07870 [Candidatus Raymondbacteria bacterium RIFOXYA2_FULL_49_16]OGJ96582.1 MAG: hypothetical protein A2487_10580 [Candidatus Raymondbacteria bacterium RifOxyC12_full_50_8]OGK00261.1 MAG: hypothetical protein A2519_01245 [Candidatus Raymondbacteria bacterium RIFOXYD12_FULL_49_13]OGK02092.1 MAG: hypothetical protein A2350_21270 [Candidatus Raymondbacteria bacterium RifOxyB12_full_50_8]OGP42320.1 MAG: hypothetical protein A2324_20100 [Candidatus Raymondbacteria b
MKKTLKKLGLALGIGVAAALLITGMVRKLMPQLWTNLENKTYDFRYQLKYLGSSAFSSTGMEGVRTVDLIEDVVIVNIDERSMLSDKLGVYYKWPRSYHGDVVEYLKSGNAAVEVFDIHFNDADFGVKESNRFMDMLAQRQGALSFTKADFSRLHQAIATGVNYDSQFVQSTQRAGNVIHAMILNDTLNYDNRSDYMARTTEKHRLESNPESSTKMEAMSIERLPKKTVLDGAFPELAQAADRIALVNVAADEDAIHRTIPLLNVFRGYVYPALSLQTCLKVMGKRLKDVTFVPGKYIDCGKPFYLRREADSSLTVSYPGMNGTMVRALLRRAPEIKALKVGGNLIITEKAVVRKDQTGAITCDIPAGILGFSTIRDLNGVTAEQFLGMPENEPIGVGQSTAIQRVGEKEFTIIEVDNGENAIEYIPLSTLLLVAGLNGKTIMALKNGETLPVSEQLTVWRKADGLYTEYTLLRGKTLDQLLALIEKDINAIKPNETVSFGDPIRIPVDESSRMRINYKGQKQATFKTVSYYDILAKRVPREYFAGKIFLIGSNAPSMFDLVGSPVAAEYPGVEIHATCIDNILHTDFMEPVEPLPMFLVVLALCLATSLAVFFVKPLFGIGVSVALALGYIYVVTFTYFFNNVDFEVVRPVLGIFASFIGVLVYRYITEERDKKFLKATFSNYLSPELIDVMYETKQRPQLGGDEGVRTAYFTDIQGFSTFSEKLGSPTKLVELLNEYLSAQTDILMSEQGTLDKYEGDAIIAFFGAPMPLPDHATRACKTALKMQSKLGELRLKWQSEGEKWPTIVHEMRMRIGVNSGPIVTGNMGSTMRMNYTMMGDAVNLAARLESGSKQYGSFSTCSNDTLKLTDGSILAREIDLLRVVGKNEPVAIHELLCLKTEADEKMQKLVETFSQALAAYRATKWDDAIALYEEALKYEIWYPQPGVKTCPSKVMLQRCIEYKENPPVKKGEPWDGVYTATEK